MTTPEERRQEFFDECLDDDEAETNRLESTPDQKREAERYRNLAGYHYQAAEDLLQGKAELLAIREGYYVMLHKANQALALAGFKPRSHKCTLLGLRGIFNAPDLANDFNRASTERNNVDYAMSPHRPQLEEFDGPRSFIQDVVKPFGEAVDDCIEETLDISDEGWKPGVTPDEDLF